MFIEEKKIKYTSKRNQKITKTIGIFKCDLKEIGFFVVANKLFKRVVSFHLFSFLKKDLF